MATQTATNPDTQISIKVSLDGINRRFRVALRELGPNVFPDKLRNLLNIPAKQQVIFERFSDSAGAFITLDSNNPSIYKQLYRAAKAKLKLRIRATVITEPTNSTETSKQENASAATFLQPPKTETLGSTPLHKLIELANTAPMVVNGSPDQLPSEEKLTKASYKESSFLPQEVEPQLSLATRPKPSAEAPVPQPFSIISDSFPAEIAALKERLRAIDPKFPCGPPRPLHSDSHYTVYCNKCDSAIPDDHYHCNICDNGDYDLCKNCVDSGVTCEGQGHWLIKRYLKAGKFVTSTTEKISPKKPENPGSFNGSAHFQKMACIGDLKTDSEKAFDVAARTCNNCIESLPESQFVKCASCYDFDLCISCLVEMKHGHHPAHPFVPAGEKVLLNPLLKKLCEPGRDRHHLAICDGCDKNIRGIRHKCLDCPDWDYCSECILSARDIHPGHRFTPIYDQLAPARTRVVRHHGIFCDGVLCRGKSLQTYIVGDRYKCAVCHDTDFCANCEASPANLHNKTHPLIKFKTPVRDVTVSTEGEKINGESMPVMGDAHARTRSTGTDSRSSISSTNAATQVQTVADLQPTVEDVPAEREPQSAPPSPKPLQAHFVCDTIQDGSSLPTQTLFYQTWTLENPGPASWPAGCTVQFTGGDRLFNLDLNHICDVVELKKAGETNATTSEIPAGHLFNFTVEMRTPKTPGRKVSYWRLAAPNGEKFGHKLWVDIHVQDQVAAVETIKNASVTTTSNSELTEVPKIQSPVQESAMIFPKLEKESPVSSQHEAQATGPSANEDDVESLTEEVEGLAIEGDEDDSYDEGFLTDEEYDILNASDEEFLEASMKATK